MPVTFNALTPLAYVYRLETQSDTMSQVAGARDFDFFPDSGVQVGDAILFLQSNGNAGKFQGLNFDIAEALTADEITGVWEYARFDAVVNSTYGTRWEPLQHVRDDTNSFQNPGANTVTWEVPKDWENHLNAYYGHSGSAQYYHWYVRFRITSISGLSLGGRQSNTVVSTKNMILDINNEGQTTLDDIYAMDKAGQVDLDSRQNITTVDPAAVLFSDFLRPADYRVLGGAGNDLWVEVANYSGFTGIEITITGTDVADNPQSEVISVTDNGIIYVSKYFKKLHESSVTAVTGTGSFDYKVVMGQLGVVHKTGNSQFAFECTLSTRGNTVLTTKQEQVLFFKNWYPKIRSKIIMGEIFSSDKAYNGSNWIFEIEYGDASNTFIAYTNSEIYNSQFKFKELGGSTQNHGFWGGALGQDIGQKIIDIYGENFRHFSFMNDNNTVIGAKGYGLHLEYPGAVCKEISCYGANYCVRPLYVNNNDYMHQCDFSGSLAKPINPWNVTVLSGGVLDWKMDFVDCHWGAYKAGDKFSWRLLVEEPQNEQRAYETYSLLFNVVDSQGNAIPGSSIRLVDNTSNQVLSLTTTAQGYIGLDTGAVTSATTSSLVDDTKSWSVDEWRFHEVYIVSGSGEGQRRIIKNGSSTTVLQVTPDFDIIPDETSTYIIVPYIRIAEYVPNRTQGGSYKNSVITQSNPFTLHMSKPGYETHTEEITIDEKTIVTRVQKIKKSQFDGLSG